jgi:hypothetical protein
MTEDPKIVPSKVIQLPGTTRLDDAEPTRTQEVPPPTPEEVKRQQDTVEAGYATMFRSLRLLQTASVAGWEVTSVPGGWLIVRALTIGGYNKLTPGPMQKAESHVVSCFIPFPIDRTPKPGVVAKVRRMFAK